jgi:undecaprenyl diphosphate synthase
VGLYDRYLAVRVRRDDADPPDHVVVVLTERDLLEAGAYETLTRVLGWAFEYGASRVTVYVSVLDADAIPTLEREFNRLDAPRPVAVRTPGDEAPAEAPITVSIGHGGKREFATAVRSIADRVAEGEIEPAEIDARTIEDRLVFPSDPDLVIKTGAERLSDFMIWQSVYAELHFTDVNWRDFRKRDFLRALREYKERSRRFGR